jgi:PAS domain S-box-containing protein
MMIRLTRPRSLFSHISFHLFLLSLLTVLAVGIPAILFIQFETEKQIWAQIDQGARTSLALFDLKEIELANSAKLVAERPTLLELIQLDDQLALTLYLSILQDGIQSDSITICNQAGEILVETHRFKDLQLCPQQNYLTVVHNPTEEAWLFKTHPILVNMQAIGTAIVGEKIDNQFAASMRNDIGMDYYILSGGNFLASSLDAEQSALLEKEIETEVDNSQPENHPLKFTIGDTPYYAITFPVNRDGLTAVLALPTGEILRTSQKQIMLMFAGVFTVLCMSILLSRWIARRISLPLEELSSQADRSRSEFIKTPITTDSKIKELTQLADAYEHARLDLSQKVSQLQLEQDWIEHLLEAIAEGILTLDSENKILFFSPAAERITGWKKEEVLHNPVDDYFTLIEKDGGFSENLPSPGEKYFLNVLLAQNKQATLSISGAEFFPSQASDSQIALVFRDVTEEVAINRLLGQFLSNVAHEFRTPLSALSASVELLEDQFPDFNSSEVMELIRSQKLGVLGLETLIDNLLESSSIEARRFRVTPRSFDIEEIISDVEQTLAPLLEKHGQRLIVKFPLELPLVYGDPRRTVQVLINLLSNAIKYGPENSEISLQAYERDRKVRVMISDHGPGISPEYRQEIFTRFNIPRTENERAKPGAGLGLSVVKAIVEAQGGNVGVEDNPGSGACFWFTMRLAKSK